MANFTNNTVTVEGRKLIANSLLNGTGIEFTHFSVGDGEPPTAPEDLSAVVHELFTVAVSKVHASETEDGVTVIRGSFKNAAEKGDFYFRELGIYARQQGTTDTPILFGYTSADPADYIPTVGIGSPVEQGIVLSIVTGNASVLYIESSLVAATWSDVKENNDKIKTEIDQFTEEKIAEITKAVNDLDTKLKEAADELAKAEEGFVLKAGDTMTGDLNMGEHNVVGSATKWGGWLMFSGLDKLNEAMGTSLTEASKMLEIGQSMPSMSRLIHATSSADATVSAECYPNKNGVLEIVKYSETRCAYTFTSSNGNRWQSASHTDEPNWRGWITADGIPAGVMHEYAGATAPYGYLLCQGQSLAVADYPALFAVIGYTYGGSGNKFNIPDMRGLFARGYDAGRGIDSGRKLGTTQDSGAPNITGSFGGIYTLGTNGAFCLPDGSAGTGWGNGGGYTYPARVLGFDASRSSAVYQDVLTEVRPANIAVNYIIKY